MFEGSVMDANEEQLQNNREPRAVMVEGSVIDVNDEQSLNTP